MHAARGEKESCVTPQLGVQIDVTVECSQKAWDIGCSQTGSEAGCSGGEARYVQLAVVRKEVR